MKSRESKLMEWFQWFHQHPELSYEEYGTTAKIREILMEEGVEILPCPLETGMVAVIRGKAKGPVRALRCDIDALPIQEDSGLSYSSEYPGRMHACGHDFHIMIGIGCAMLLNERKMELAGSVKIIFQPAEETSLGVGCHGAHPDDGRDPIPAAAAIVQAFQTIVTRNVNAFHPALISVTRMEAGNTWNVIPETALLEGTVRTMDGRDRSLFEQRVKEIARYTASSYGMRADVQWVAGPPATLNDEEMAKVSRMKALEMGFQVVPEESSMGGDDFAFLEEKIPGCYLKIGTGKGQLIHQPGFVVDVEAIIPAIRYVAELVANGPS